MSRQLLYQVDVVVAAWVARRPPAFGVAEPGIESWGLEGMGAQGHPVAAAAPDLGFGGGQQVGAQAEAALAAPHPEQIDVAAPAPGPPVQAAAQVAVVPADGHAQHAGVLVAAGGGVEGTDLLVEASGEVSVAVTDGEPGLTQHRPP